MAHELSKPMGCPVPYLTVTSRDTWKSRLVIKEVQVEANSGPIFAANRSSCSHTGNLSVAFVRSREKIDLSPEAVVSSNFFTAHS